MPSIPSCRARLGQRSSVWRGRLHYRWSPRWRRPISLRRGLRRVSRVSARVEHRSIAASRGVVQRLLFAARRSRVRVAQACRPPRSRSQTGCSAFEQALQVAHALSGAHGLARPAVFSRSRLTSRGGAGGAGRIACPARARPCRLDKPARLVLHLRRKPRRLPAQRSARFGQLDPVSTELPGAECSSLFRPPPCRRCSRRLDPARLGACPDTYDSGPGAVSVSAGSGGRAVSASSARSSFLALDQLAGGLRDLWNRGLRQREDQSNAGDDMAKLTSLGVRSALRCA